MKCAVICGESEPPKVPADPVLCLAKGDPDSRCAAAGQCRCRSSGKNGGEAPSGWPHPGVEKIGANAPDYERLARDMVKKVGRSDYEGHGQEGRKNWPMLKQGFLKNCPAIGEGEGSCLQ